MLLNVITLPTGSRLRDEINKKIIEVEDKISEAKIEYNNLKEHSEEVNNSLAAERDQFQDDARHFNGECEENMMKLDSLNVNCCKRIDDIQFLVATE